MKIFIILILLISQVCISSDQFIFPLAEDTVIENYAKKISIKRTKYQVLRDIDRFRSDSKKLNKIINEKPHEKVIESIYAENGPQISTVAITKDEVIPFYSNFFREKIFIQHQMQRSWKDRAFQRVLQFRHQNELGNSQIGGL